MTSRVELPCALWHYEAEPDDGTKVDYLLKFFEALAQFAAAVLLSACITERELVDANRPAWFGSGLARRLRRATFGEWAELTERLTGTVRTVLEATAARNAAADCSGPETWTLPRR